LYPKCGIAPSQAAKGYFLAHFGYKPLHYRTLLSQGASLPGGTAVSSEAEGLPMHHGVTVDLGLSRLPVSTPATERLTAKF